MSRGRGNYSSPRGNSYRGSSNRGSSSWSGRGTYPRGGGGGSGSRFPSFSSSYDSRSKYSSSDRFNSSRPHDDYRRSYRPDSSYSGRDHHRSPERKKLRAEAPSSYGGYGSTRYESSNYSDRRSFSGDRHSGSVSRRDDFRRPSGPPPPSRGSYRGRVSSRGSRGLKFRERPTRRRLVESSYAIRKRVLTARTSDYARRLKISRLRSAIARRVVKKREDDSDKETSDNEKDEKAKDPENKDETKEGEKKSPKKEEEGAAKEEKSPRKTFIKLSCPHCSIKVLTFRKYDMHLQSRTHLMAMRKIAFKQKSILAQMRQAQRNTQNELEKSSDDLTQKTNFCPLCKLNYKQRKAVHQSSEAHKNMKKFLMPHCKVCNITFKSPMIFESHCCSIEHIKRKQRVENGNSDASAEEDNLENFTTIDSVGDGEDGDEKKEEGKEPVNVGIEQIKKIEAHYCDLCKMYLPRTTNEEEVPKILSKHCKQRVHLQRYVRFKEDKDLEERAEKLQRKETAEKEDKIKTEDKTKTETTKEGEKSVDDDEATEDKIWEDVDKDLGDIIAEAESANKSSDEDEEDDSHVNGERYDRFKLSEKNGEEVLKEGELNEESSEKKLENEVKDEK